MLYVVVIKDGEKQGFFSGQLPIKLVTEQRVSWALKFMNGDAAKEFMQAIEQTQNIHIDYHVVPIKG